MASVDPSHIFSVPCLHCGASAWVPCQAPDGGNYQLKYHRPRYLAWRQALGRGFTNLVVFRVDVQDIRDVLALYRDAGVHQDREQADVLLSQALGEIWATKKGDIVKGLVMDHLGEALERMDNEKGGEDARGNSEESGAGTGT